jgi:protein involved in polysaccharide export with SLBB domain
MRISNSTKRSFGSLVAAAVRLIAAALIAALLACVCVPSSAAQAAVSSNYTERPELVATAGAPGTRAATDQDRPALQSRNPRYRLCASDVIALTFPLTPEYSQTVSVQPDGFITLAGAGDVHVQGLTTQETVPAIQAAYVNVLHNSIVTIELKDFNKPYFIVGGQVFHPGKFDLRGYTTATEAVALAGGFEESAKHSQVLLFRRVNDSWTEVKNLDLKHILQGHNVNEDPEIRPGDMLFVPQNLISKVKKFIPNYGMGAYATMYP